MTIRNVEAAADILRSTITRSHGLSTDDVEHLIAMIENGQLEAAFVAAGHHLHDQEVVVDHRTRSALKDVARFYGLDAHLWDALPTS